MLADLAEILEEGHVAGQDLQVIAAGIRADRGGIGCPRVIGRDDQRSSGGMCSRPRARES